MHRIIHNPFHTFYDSVKRNHKQIRKKFIDVLKLSVAFAAGITIILLIQFFLRGSIKVLADPLVASILAIAGIVATVSVGVVIFLMQKRADNRINKIITSEDNQRRLQKTYSCNKVLSNWNRIKDILQQIKTIVQAFPANSSNERFLNDSRVFVLLNDFGITNRWIPGILEANEFLFNHFADLALHEELKTVEAFGGPSAVMRDEYIKGDVYGGLMDDSSRAFKISAIDSDLQLMRILVEEYNTNLSLNHSVI